MIVTRRRFVAGAVAVPVAGVAIAKLALPRLLPAPNTDTAISGWTIGLLGEGGRELTCFGYHRFSLDMREHDSGIDLVLANGVREIKWDFSTLKVLVTAWAVWMPGVDRPVRVCRDHFPQTIVYAFLSLVVQPENFVVRLS